MKVRNPNSRSDLRIKSSDKVLEVGGGHNPHPRSNVVVDKYIDSNYHRNGDIKVLKNQKFLQADGENLPFADKEFDYVICNQVLEHVEDPIAFLKEQSRVSKGGFMETPSLIGEYLFPKESHKWLILEIDKTLVLVDKKLVDFKPCCDFGNLFLNFLPKYSLSYKILLDMNPNLHTVRYEWKDEITCIVNPTDERILKYFREPWSMETVKEYVPQRSNFTEILKTIRSGFSVIYTASKNKVLKQVS